jgi:predicted kinase
MRKIILLRGLPGSGKSTWARAMIRKNPDQYKRVNKDDLRMMIDDDMWSSSNEKFILHIRNVIIAEALKSGKDVIVDDTNLHPKHEKYLRKVALEFGAVLEFQDFLDISVEECIARDSKRSKPVGEKIIREMATRYLSQNS